MFAASLGLRSQFEALRAVPASSCLATRAPVHQPTVPPSLAQEHWSAQLFAANRDHLARQSVNAECAVLQREPD